MTMQMKAVCKCPVCGADMEFNVEGGYFRCTANHNHQMTLAEWSELKEPRKLGEIVDAMEQRVARLRRLAMPVFARK